MTLPDFESLLKTVHPSVWELAAPEGCTRFVCYAKIGESGIAGDDTVVLSFDRMQLDIVTQHPQDPLPDLITGLLSREYIPYRMTRCGYDSNRALHISTYEVML